MKKLLAGVLVVTMVWAGCGKKEMGCTPVSPQSENFKSRITERKSLNPQSFKCWGFLF